MTRDEMIRALAEVVAGLQVPMSMGMPLGAAMDPWRKLHGEIGFGWHDVDQVEAKLHQVLDVGSGGPHGHG